MSITFKPIAATHTFRCCGWDDDDPDDCNERCTRHIIEDGMWWAVSVCPNERCIANAIAFQLAPDGPKHSVTPFTEEEAP